MFAKPQSEHQWFEGLEGRWTAESECRMAPDQPPQKAVGEVSVRSMGGLWIVVEGQGESPESGPWSTSMQVGYDPQQGRYIGTFIGSMMTHLWLYSGCVDPSGRRLVLDTQGPRFDREGTARYQDIIQRVDNDHWILSSQILDDDGQWHNVMVAHHRRRA